jgi:Cupin-like domain
MGVPQTQIWKLSKRRGYQAIRLPQTYLKNLTCINVRRNVSTIRYTSPDILADENIGHFRQGYFQAEKPAVLRSADLCLKLPAYSRWFLETASNHSQGEKKGVQVQLNYDYISKYGDVLVPLELTSSPSKSEEIKNDVDACINNTQFERFQAPLSMFLNWTAAADRQKGAPTNANMNTNNNNNNTQIYLAQCHLEDLPPQLQSDFHPTPSLVSQTGKNDVYATNLWIGAPPTYSPLHKDPNPNLFVQLAGLKHVRLLSPSAGLQVFARVQQEMMNTTTNDGFSATFRGNEMMQGSERLLLERAVWGHSSSSSSTDAQNQARYDVILERGDSLFIPKGWWHSIKGVGEGITASVCLFFLSFWI